MLAVTLDARGRPRLAEIEEPPAPALRVVAAGLCGSDAEKIGRAPAGTVLGHEVVAERQDGRLVALVHHRPMRRLRALPRGARVDVRGLRRAHHRPGRLR